MPHAELQNETPFAFEQVYVTNEDGRSLLVLLVKATYALRKDGLHLAETQVPVDLEGKSWGAPGESSYKFEPEGAFFKPTTDVVLIGHAHPPARGATETLVALQVGALKKALRVLGERTWFKSMGRVAATQPLAFEKLPLTWERAFGGWDRTDSANPAFEPRNPVGVGYRASPRHFEEGLKLPNLESPEEPLREFGQRVSPVGFGFTSPHWQPRARLAGTYDEAWRKSRQPRLPTDFDRRFFNAAAPGLITPSYLKGNEAVILVNASHRGRLAFELPSQAPPAITVRMGGSQSPDLHLDTVILNTDAHQVQLLWRGHVLLDRGPHDVRSIDILV